MSDDRRERPRTTFSEEDLDTPDRPRPRTSFSENDLPPEAPPSPRPARPAPAGPGAGSPTRPARRPRGRRRRVRPGLIIGTIVVAWLVFLIGTPIHAWGAATKEPVFSADRPPEQPGTTYLLAGSDSREGLSEEERQRLGTGDAEGHRADTMILFHVPQTGPPVMISLPRDSYVPIPGHGEDKLNAAYAIGGAPLMVQTVEQVTGVRIDHYVEVGFGGFVNVIDAVRGVEICPETDLKDKLSRLDVKAGCQNADGPTALAYARMRYADPLGDLGRVQRQREILGGVAKKLASPMTVIIPTRWWGVNVGLAQALTVDDQMHLFDLVKTAPAVASMGGGKGLTLTVPIENPDYQTPSGSAIKWDSEQALAMFGQIKAGDTTGMERFR